MWVRGGVEDLQGTQADSLQPEIFLVSFGNTLPPSPQTWIL